MSGSTKQPEGGTVTGGGAGTGLLGAMLAQQNSQKKPDGKPIQGCPLEPKPGIQVQPIGPFQEPVGEISDPVKVQIRSSGTAPLVLGDVTLTGADAREFSFMGESTANRKLEPGTTFEEMQLYFRPKTAGEKTANLCVASNAEGSPTVVPLGGEGTVPEIDVSPMPASFDEVPVKTEKPLQFTIKNTGKAPLTVSKLEIAGKHASDFKVSKSALDAPVAAKSSATFDVTFAPTAAGIRSAQLKVTSDAPVLGCPQVFLTGTGFAIKDLKIPEFLAAEAETVKIEYTVEDPAAAVKSGTLEVFGKKGGTAILSRPLEEAERRNGKVSIDWKGALAATSADFPDACVTAAHSPYKLKVSLAGAAPSGGGAAPAASVETTFKVEVGKIELELGPKAVVKNARHQAVYDTIGTLPAPSQKKKLSLVSNLFSTWGDEMATDPTSFNVYRDHATQGWGDGPVIPIYAKLLVKKSTGGEVEAPKALGTVTVLWDYRDVPEDTSVLHSKARRFIDDARDRDKSTSKPAGDNCPQDLGGKRTLDGSDAVLPASASFGADVDAFPFTVTKGATRKWAAFSEPARTGANAGKTGIIFRPSRVAGDAYEIVAYVDPDKALDKEGAIDAPVKAATGSFTTWREVHLVKVFRKSATTDTYNHDEVTPFYEKVYIDLVKKAVNPELIPDCDDRFKRAIDAVGGKLAEFAVDDKEHQSTKGGHAAVGVKSHDDFVAAYVAAFDAANFATLRANPAANAFTDQQLHDFLEAQAKNELVTAGLSHATPAVAKKKYANECVKFSKDVLLKACNDALASVADDGVIVFFFQGECNNRGDADKNRINGSALNPSKHLGTNRLTRTKTGYVQVAPPSYYTGTKSMSQTISHEIGHCLFLMHTITEASATDPDAHDQDEDGCLMGYNFDVKRNFCGYCNLRLRGWNHTLLNKSSTANAKRPAIDVAPPAGFAATSVGSESAPADVTIQSTGQAPLQLGEIVLDGPQRGDFELRELDTVQKKVDPGGSTTLKVVFKPATAGDKSAELVIPSNAPDAPKVVALRTTGLAAPVPTIAPASPIDFGSVRRDTDSAPTRITVTNTGDVPLRMNALKLEGPDAFDFEIRDDHVSSQTLARNAPATVDIVFHSRAKGDKKATLIVASSAAGLPSTVELKAKSVLQPVLDAPALPAFPDVAVGDEHVQTLTITNTGSAPLTVASVRFMGFAPAFSVENDNASGKTIAAGKSATVGIKFKPNARGDERETLAITSDDPASPKNMDVRGKGLAPKVEMAPAAPFSFATTKVGVESPATSFTIRNTGDAPLVIERIRLHRSGAGDFLIKANPVIPPAKLTIDPGRDATVEIAFKPTQAKNTRAKIEIKSSTHAYDHEIKGTGT